MKTSDAAQPFQIRRIVMAVFWPSFLMACISSGLIFSLIDPNDLVFLSKDIHLSSIAIYTLGFVVFWFLGSIASGLTALLILEFEDLG